MPPASRNFNSPLYRVRTYFGMTQAELARYLGISEALANQLEAGRRTVSPEVSERLAPLLGQVREGAADVPLPFSPPAGKPHLELLTARHRDCLYQATRLRGELAKFPEQARRVARWARALPALQASVPLAGTTPPPADHDAGQEVIRQTYVRDMLDRADTTLDPEALSRWHLLLVRAQALEAEAAALAALLG